MKATLERVEAKLRTHAVRAEMVEGERQPEEAPQEEPLAALLASAELREAALRTELAERNDQIKELSYFVGRLERKARASTSPVRRAGAKAGLTPALARAERQAAENAQLQRRGVAGIG